MSNISELLDLVANEIPKSPAITSRRRGLDETLSFRRLQECVCCEALRLRKLGLRPGNRILVMCSPGMRLYISVLAIFRIGATAVFVDPGAGLKRLNECCRAAELTAVLATPAAWMLRPLVPELRWKPRWIRVCRRFDRIADRVSAEVVGSDHSALLTFTSGSTGEPRGVIRSHGFLAIQQAAIARECELHAGESQLLTMPMFVLSNLAAGLHSIVGDVRLRKPRNDSPQRLISQIEASHPSRLLVSPSLLDELARYAIRESRVLASVRRITTGGAPVFPRTILAAKLAMPNARVDVVYGSTEAEPISVLSWSAGQTCDYLQTREGFGLPAGKLCEDISVRLLSTHWNRTPDSEASHDIGPQVVSVEALDSHTLSFPCTGEIVVSGERVLKGYLNSAGDRESKIRVGERIWHRTGDVGRFDEHGRLWLLGRLAGRVCDRRGSLEAFRVEAAAMEHANVRRCALTAIAGRRVLIVEAAGREPNSRSEWKSNLMKQLAWAELDEVKEVRRIPLDRRHHAKVDYPALRALVGADPEGKDRMT
ncbi:MAG: AMP-binding protein [Planctomyces sp.]|nr:AMP-binding protein [Planctomyces sp.]